MVTREVFNPEGNRTERWHRGTDGSEVCAWWFYDESGRLRSYETTGLFPEISLYDYDSQSRLLQVTSRSPDGERVSQSYSYGDDGSSTLTIRPHTVPQHVQIGVDAESMLRFSVDAVRIVVYHDAHGRPRWRALYDADGGTIRKVSFRYDAAGYLLEEGEINPEGGISEDFRDRYRYDAEGRCVEKEVRRSGISNRRTTMAHNEHGDLAEASIHPLPGSIDLSTSIPPEYRPRTSWTTRYSYEYDEHANWTARTETRISSGTPAPPALMTSRQLQY